MRLNIRKRWKICANGLILLALICSISGCASLVAKTPPPVLLQEDKIYTVPAGQEIMVELDHRPLKLTFPYPMKLMSIDRAIRDEQTLNDNMLKSVKAGGERNKTLGIVGSILAILAFVIGIFFKMKKWGPNIKANVEVK